MNFSKFTKTSFLCKKITHEPELKSAKSIVLLKRITYDVGYSMVFSGQCVCSLLKTSYLK